MTTYTGVFGGANIYPSEISYSAVALTTDLTLNWPDETSAASNFATRIIDVTPDAAGRAITLPDADKAGTGETILFNNLGAHTFTVKNAAGVQVGSVPAGTLVQLYLTVNTTAAGSWRALQYGVGTSQVDASTLAGTGIVAVGTLLSQSVPVSTFNTNYTAGTTDRAKMFVWTGAGGVFTLPAASVVGNNWFCYLRNSGTGAIAATPAGTESIDGGSSLSFQIGDSACIICDGSNFYTIGFGQSATFAFDYTAINIAGTGAYTLSGSELNRIAYNLTGALTGNREVVVPATVQQYWVSNNTTGSYSLTVKTAAGTGVVVNQSQSAILYSNGTDVVLADTAGVATPVSVADGGTGATTASGARINLGGTALGIAVFTAASSAAAYAALGVAPAGVVDGGTF